ncbi:WD40 repeat-like protein [Coprinopsis marcescibilis]|uniref:WD40 repeat-like protein n=1 Tax=Coprinopsis marcescibilis TaxID=230819 RepID=A0A5C3LB51_COPMA|nr:WD40 repeat-like protein [Coprinopsis marcescibilis]
MLGDPNDFAFHFEVAKTYSTPATVSSLAFGHSFHLYAGSGDGSLRVYDLSTHKVIKAIRSLGDEVSSILCMKRSGSELRDAWIAHGTKISKFQLDTPKMILSPEDALQTIQIGETEDDVVNELALHYNKTHLGLGTDAGNIVLVDLATDEVTKTKTKHTSICGGVQFIADRGRDIVSAGYDHKFMHHDFVSGELISEMTLVATPTESNTSATLSPPFIMSFGVSSTGVIVGGSACGRLWIGIGGEKRPSRKKTKRWEGLRESESAGIIAAQGPIVSVYFSEARTFTTSTLLGLITQWEIVYQEEERRILLKMLWQGETKNLEKVNKLIADQNRIIVGGLTKDGKGLIEVWQKEPLPEPKEIEDGQEHVEVESTITSTTTE